MDETTTRCPDCGTLFVDSESELGERCCPECAEIRRQKLAERLSQSFAGGQSSLNEGQEPWWCIGNSNQGRHSLPPSARNDARRRRYKHE